MIGRVSLTGRLTVLFAGGSAVVLTILGTLIGSEIERHFVSEDRGVLDGKIELARQLIERIDSPAKLDQLPFQLEDALVGHHDLVAQVIGPRGELVLQTIPVELPGLADAPLSILDGARMEIWDHDGRRYRGVRVAIATAMPGLPPLQVAIAIDLIHHEAFLASFNRSLWLFVIAAAGLTGLIGWFAAWRGLLPLKDMRARASAVTAERLDQRLPVDAVPSELADLAMTLNEMLSRLEEAFRRLSDFSSDIAHELRTPVSNLITETQVALSKARDAETYRQTLESNAEEFDRLSRMISDMLLLAKAENGLMLPNHDEVDLCRQLSQLLEFYEPVTESKHITVDLSGHCHLAGDALMLRRAFGNLLSNAVRYTPDGGQIAVRLRNDGATVAVTIANTGKKIASEHLPHLFDRFYRADAARRHEGVEGTGLGLSITRAIVEAHGGTVTATSNDDSTEFTVRLPRGDTTRASAADPG